MAASLVDDKGRVIKYLRLSITDRCNYRCTYCMPAEGFEWVPRAEVLRFDELSRVARIFSMLGVDTVRITGGEPTVRSGLADLVARIAEVDGIGDIAMTTNGHRLPELAGPLRRAGLKRLNVSLDTLRPEVHAKLTRGADLRRVVDGLDAARDAGFENIKLNTVVIRGTNDDEVEDIVDFAWSRGFTPRFIELMPLGEAGRMHGKDAVLPTAELLERLAHRLAPEPALPGAPGRGPAVYRASKDDPTKVAGFIGAVTEKFCSTCNRLRVTARGELRACLARPEGVDLRAMLRDGHSDEHIARRIQEAVYGRRDGHEFWEETPGDTSGLVIMTGVGG